MNKLNVANKLLERGTVDPDHPPQQPNARVLYDYWLDKRADRAFPSWKDIDLLDLWRIAPCLIVKDVIDGGADFRNRYWGTRIAEKAGFDATGQTHSNIYRDQPLGPQMETYEIVVKTRRPCTVFRSSTFIEGREFIVYHSLNLPLGETDGRVDNIIVVVDYV